MIETKKNGISIPDFMEAISRSGKSGEFWKTVREWKETFAVVEAYHLGRNKTTKMRRELSEKIDEDGVHFFKENEELNAKKAYEMLFDVDEKYAVETGRHFQVDYGCKSFCEMAEYLLWFLSEYNAYKIRRLGIG